MVVFESGDDVWHDNGMKFGDLVFQGQLLLLEALNGQGICPGFNKSINCQVHVSMLDFNLRQLNAQFCQVLVGHFVPRYVFQAVLTAFTIFIGRGTTRLSIPEMFLTEKELWANHGQGE